MLNRVDGIHELDQVNMLIRALSDEMERGRTDNSANASPSALQVEMEEAMYQLRVKKLVYSALAARDRRHRKTTRH